MSKIRTLLYIVLVVILGTSLAGMGELLRYGARENLTRLDELTSGGGIDYSLEKVGRSDEIIDRDLKRLKENRFFTLDVKTHPSIASLSGTLTSIKSNMKFKDAWDLLWYLEYLGDVEGIAEAVQSLLKDGYFKQTNRCLRKEECGVLDAASNLNPEDGSKLFQIIDRTFIIPALQSVDRLEFENAYKLGVDAQFLVRAIDFDSSQSPDPFNKVLALSTFLSSQHVADGSLRYQDLVKLEEAISGNEVQTTDFVDPLIASYVSGLNELRDGCFENSYFTFKNAASKTTTDGQRDLFSFLSLRAISRPFVSISKLTLHEGELKIEDCDRLNSAREYVEKFQDTKKNEFYRLSSIGLKTDIEFYERHLPISGERTNEIDRYIKKKSTASSQSTAEHRTTSKVEKIRSVSIEKNAIEDISLNPEAPKLIEASQRASVWPLDGIVVKKEGHSELDGIYLKASLRTPIVAAHAGTVSLSDVSTATYGRSIQITGEDGKFSSFYANLGDFFVGDGDQVVAGQTIASLSFNGPMGGNTLFFQLLNSEIQSPLSPAALLPDRKLMISEDGDSEKVTTYIVKRDDGSIRTALKRNYISSIVVDVDSGNVLEEYNADKMNGPASLTKIMTLYLLFESLNNKKISMNDTFIMTSSASEMPPSKLGMNVGESITVEKAIGALVTKSANDVSELIAEELAGSTRVFASMMTEKARELGMADTTFLNASGLTEHGQYTTARDMALLSSEIVTRFPQLSKLFSLRTFAHNEQVYGNFNKLLGRTNGVYGLKTGYTEQSGYNIAIAAKNESKSIVAVILGSPTAKQRNQDAHELIGQYINQ